MGTILIFVLKQENLIKVVYTQNGSARQELEEYPGCRVETDRGQVKIWGYECDSLQGDTPLLIVPVSRTIIKYIDG